MHLFCLLCFALLASVPLSAQKAVVNDAAPSAVLQANQLGSYLKPEPLSPQAVRIAVGPQEETGICEPSIAIDPTKPNTVYAAAVLNHFYESTDGGLTWQASQLHSTYGVWGDPCLVVDGTGRVYYFHLSDPSGQNWRGENYLDRIVCQTKDGPGPYYSFTNGSFTEVNGKKHDKEWAAVDPRTGKIALTWTQFDQYGTKDEGCTSRILYSESVDGGISWSEPVAPSAFVGDCVDDDGTAEGVVPAFDSRGNVYFSWALNNTLYFTKNKGRTGWETAAIGTQKAGWAQSYAGFSRSNGMPVTACDTYERSPYHNRIYVCWGDQNDRKGGEIYIMHSDNAGKSWSTPRSIGGSGASDQFMPWLAVDPTSGYLYAVYYDRRDTKTANETNTYLAVSKDGGDHWEEQKLNTSPFYPSDKVFMGDYNHISAYDGHVRPIWTELNNGQKSIWTYLYTETQE